MQQLESQIKRAYYHQLLIQSSQLTKRAYYHQLQKTMQQLESQIKRAYYHQLLIQNSQLTKRAYYHHQLLIHNSQLTKSAYYHQLQKIMQQLGRLTSLSNAKKIGQTKTNHKHSFFYF